MFMILIFQADLRKDLLLTQYSKPVDNDKDAANSGKKIYWVAPLGFRQSNAQGLSKFLNGSEVN